MWPQASGVVGVLCSRNHFFSPCTWQVLLKHHEEEMSSSLSGEIQRLQEQNASLRSSVAQMRAQMEALSERTLPFAPPGAGPGNPRLSSMEAASDAALGEQGHGHLRGALRCERPPVRHFRCDSCFLQGKDFVNVIHRIGTSCW